MVNPGVNPAQHSQGAHYFIYDLALIERPGPEQFQSQWWQRQHKLAGHAAGRGAVVFLDTGDPGWVLRHYRRGGVVAHWVHDHYLWLGLERSRAFSEWRLLAALLQQGLPVPRPVAAHVERDGLRYRADLITERIANAGTLAQHLYGQTLDVAGWHRLGAVIARFHQAGVHHHDLNAHNILLDTVGQFTLIDFDKGRLLSAGAWRSSSLARLRRSLDKLAGANPGFKFSEADWRAFCSGYLDQF